MKSAGILVSGAEPALGEQSGEMSLFSFAEASLVQLLIGTAAAWGVGGEESGINQESGAPRGNIGWFWVSPGGQS